MRTLACICFVATLALAPCTSLAQGVPTEPIGGSRGPGDGGGERATIGTLASATPVDLSSGWLTNLTARWLLHPRVTRSIPATLAPAALGSRKVLADGPWARRTQAR